MSHPIKYFNDEELDTIMEIARLGLAMCYDDIADELDLSDEYLKGLQEKIEEATQ